MKRKILQKKTSLTHVAWDLKLLSSNETKAELFGSNSKWNMWLRNDSPHLYCDALRVLIFLLTVIIKKNNKHCCVAKFLRRIS